MRRLLGAIAACSGAALLIIAGAPAIAAAFFDATGKPARRIPLKPDYVKAMLAG